MENQRNNADEVLSDFNAIIKDIDFSAYNPQSADFLQALRIGLMWFLLCKKSECDDIQSNNLSSKESETPSEDEIQKKIFESKKFLQKYFDTENISFKEVAKDELNQATALVKKANARLPSSEEKKKLKNYENEITVLKNQIFI